MPKFTLGKMTVCLAALALGACATDDGLPASGMARLVLVRGLHDDHVGDNANIALDTNAQLLALPPNSYAMTDVPAGRHMLTLQNLVSRDPNCGANVPAGSAVTQPIALNAQQVKYIGIAYGAPQTAACPDGGQISITPLKGSDIGADHANDVIATASSAHWHHAGDSNLNSR